MINIEILSIKTMNKMVYNCIYRRFETAVFSQTYYRYVIFNNNLVNSMILFYLIFFYNWPLTALSASFLKTPLDINCYAYLTHKNLKLDLFHSKLNKPIFL